METADIMGFDYRIHINSFAQSTTKSTCALTIFEIN